MAKQHIYQPGIGTRDVFNAGSEKDVGVSARNWGEKQLNELGVVFEWDLELYSSGGESQEAGLLDARLRPHPKSLLGSALRDSLGLPWDDILHGQDLALHYTRLRHLATPRPVRASRVAHLATSSPPPSSQTQSEPQYEVPTNATLQSSPPLPSAYHCSGRTHISSGDKRCVGVPITSRHSTLASPSQGRDGSTTPMRPSFASTIPTTQQDPTIDREPTTVVTPECDYKAAELWSWSCTTDSTYESPFISSVTPAETEDKHEADVEYTAKACLDAVGNVLTRSCPIRQLKVLVETPDPLYIFVDGYRCSCSPDVSINIGVFGDDDGDNDGVGEYGVSPGESMRLEHQVTIHNIRGQITATLLCAAQLHCSSQRELRSKKRKRKSDTIVVYGFYWEHLSGRILRLDIHRKDMSAIGTAARRIRYPIRVRQSKAFDFKHESDRIEYFNGILSGCLQQMEKYPKFKGIIEEICSPPQ